MSDRSNRRVFSATLVTLALWNPLLADDEETRLVADQRFHAALGEQVDFRVVNIPLADLPREIQRQSNLAVRIDRAALTADSRQAELRLGISTDFHDMEVYELLQRLRRAAGLILAIDRQRQIVLTTQGGLAVDPELKHLEDARLLLTYDVSDLLVGYRLGDRLENAAGIVSELVRSNIYPTTWASVGGSCRLTIEGEQMIVEQTVWAHNELRDLLSELRRCRRLAQSWDGKTPPPRNCLWIQPARARRWIRSL